MMMEFVAFDLEIASELTPEAGPEDGLGITCAALHFYKGEVGRTQLFYPKASKTEETLNAPYPRHMAPMDARRLAQRLIDLDDAGWPITTWNGLKFDFHILAVEVEDAYLCERLAQLALNHHDMMFAFYCYRGWLLRLTKVTEAMGLGGKLAGVTGVDAVRLWRGSLEDQRKVLDYVAQDAKITAKTYAALLREGKLEWLNSKGRNSVWRLPSGVVTKGRVPSAIECIETPVPDLSWWKGYVPIPREEFYGWTGYKVAG